MEAAIKQTQMFNIAFLLHEGDKNAINVCLILEFNIKIVFLMSKQMKSQ